MRNSFKQLINSFKTLNFKFLFVIIFDLLFFIALYLSSFVFGKIMTKQAMKLQGLPLQTIGLELEQSQNILKAVNSFIYSLIIVLFFMLLFMLFNWSFFRLLIWNLVIKGKAEIKRFWRFLLANLVWTLMWIVPFLFAFYPIILIAKMASVEKPPLFPFIGLGIVVCALLHFTYLYFIGFIVKKRIKDAIRFAFVTGAAKIKHLLLPYLFIFVSFIILSFIIYPLKFLPNKISFLISLIIFVAYFAWLRFYISSAVLSIDK